MSLGRLLCRDCRALPAAASRGPRARPARRLPTPLGAQPFPLSALAIHGQRRGSNTRGEAPTPQRRRAQPGTTPPPPRACGAGSAGLREELPATATAPPQSRAAAPKRGQKSFARVPPAPERGRDGAPRRARRALRHRAPQPPAGTAPLRAPHGIPSAAPLQPRQRPPPRPGDPRSGGPAPFPFPFPAPAPRCPRRPAAPRTAGLPTATAIAVRCCALRCRPPPPLRCLLALQHGHPAGRAHAQCKGAGRRGGTPPALPRGRRAARADGRHRPAARGTPRVSGSPGGLRSVGTGNPTNPSAAHAPRAGPRVPVPLTRRVSLAHPGSPTAEHTDTSAPDTLAKRWPSKRSARLSYQQLGEGVQGFRRGISNREAHRSPYVPRITT